MFVSFNYTSANQVSYAVVKDGAGIHQQRRPRRCTASDNKVQCTVEFGSCGPPIGGLG
jgi:hypothetical protein